MDGVGNVCHQFTVNAFPIQQQDTDRTKPTKNARRRRIELDSHSWGLEI